MFTLRPVHKEANGAASYSWAWGARFLGGDRGRHLLPASPLH